MDSYRPFVFSQRQPKHVVIYQCKHLGDCVLTLPLIKRMLRALPSDAYISVITQKSSEEIFSGFGTRVRAVGLPNTVLEWIAMLRLLIGSDLMLLPHASSRGLFISKLLNIPSVGEAGIRALKFLKPNYPVPHTLVPWRHTAERYLDLARRVGLEVEKTDQKIDVSNLVPSSALDTKIAQQVPKSYVLVQPGSRWMFKTPPIDFWLKVINRLESLGRDVILIGADKGSEGELLNAISRSSNAISLAGLTTIPDLTYLLSRADYYLGVDTLSTHLASGIGVRGLVLFGPTSEKIWGPYGANSRIRAYTLEDYHCRPCHADGCGGGKVSECIVRMAPDDVVNSLMLVE